MRTREGADGMKVFLDAGVLFLAVYNLIINRNTVNIGSARETKGVWGVAGDFIGAVF